MNRAELIQTYRQRTPLRPDTKLFKDHVKELRTCREPFFKYDDLIEEARTFYSREKADRLFRERPIPDGMEGMTVTKWRRRRPDAFDFERLVEESQTFQVIEKSGESWREYYTLARILFGNEDKDRRERHKQIKDLTNREVEQC